MSADYDKRSTDLFEQIRALYNDLALHPEKDFGWARGKENARALGYDKTWLERLPAAVWESSAAVGNPFAIGPIYPGETVIDLGCGAGADVCVTSLLVGPSGRVIGVDLTPAMVEKARANTRLAGFSNVEIIEADIADIPAPDAFADVVLSNGAINLSPHKPCVLKEAFRVLKPVADSIAPTCFGMSPSRSPTSARRRLPGRGPIVSQARSWWDAS
jgi:ubiquinone/menaquinone biosynthesis C-methylase UbiE